jgi:hypothetical protein
MIVFAYWFSAQWSKFFVGANMKFQCWLIKLLRQRKWEEKRRESLCVKGSLNIAKLPFE